MEESSNLSNVETHSAQRIAGKIDSPAQLETKSNEALSSLQRDDELSPKIKELEDLLRTERERLSTSLQVPDSCHEYGI